MTLTKRQKEVLDFLVVFVNKHGYSPSFEEIAHALRLTSLATVHKHISTLERKGFVRRGYNQSRSIEVTQLPKQVRDQVIERGTRIGLPARGAFVSPMIEPVRDAQGKIVDARLRYPLDLAESVLAYSRKSLGYLSSQ